MKKSKKRKGTIKNILFVCTGNSCRSVMAEGLLRKLLKDKGIEGITVSSAGISAISGFVPMDKTVKAMKKESIDVSGYKTKRLTADLVNAADLILTMETMHKDAVVNIIPDAKEKTYLLREYINKEDGLPGFAVPDPIGKPFEIYERVLDMINVSLKELVKKI
ncbi:MAG: low molecular weight protein arginine phosphatase [Candidatus Omnitrophica bacterium]|nr:low molecular weight protein arginine phosphatase [Candidatus Omnitrophota bacterium]